MSIGVHVLPKFPKDISDRNRTSPFAFTGNKFEFRSLGSSMSLAEPNTVLNTAVADTLQGFADALEKADNFHAACEELIIGTIRQHRRVIFDGNAYSDEWTREAKARGLLSLQSVADCLPYMATDKNIALFDRQRVLCESEIRSRLEVRGETYCKVIRIEAQTMLDMTVGEIMPAVIGDSKKVLEAAQLKKQLLPDLEAVELRLATQLGTLLQQIQQASDHLRAQLDGMGKKQGWLKQSAHCRSHVLPAMAQLRSACDAAEGLSERASWPFPTYGDLLGSV